MGQTSTSQGHSGLQPPDDEDGTSYMILLQLSDALMTFQINISMEKDLNTLPIVDITPYGVWLPSEFNKTDHSLSFADYLFDPPLFAQKGETTWMMEGV